MIDFLLKSTLSLGVLYAVYIFLLEKEKMHTFNRFFLLFGLLFSLIIPFISFEIYVETIQNVQQNAVQAMPFSVVTIEEKTNYLPLILWSIYGLVTAVLLSRFIVHLIKIRQNISKNPNEKFQNTTLVLLNEKVLPHTFLNYIFINKDDFENRKIEDELFTHELTHVHQKHTFDILFIEFLKTIFWFNPLLIFYKKAIQLNHEFLADQEIVKTYNNVPFYQNLLLEKASWNNNFYLASNLNFLVTKKRLIMMTKTTSQSRALLKKLALAPVVAGLIFVSCSKTESKVSAVTPEVYLNGKKVNDSEMNKPLSELVKTKKFSSEKIIATTDGTATDSTFMEVKAVDTKNVVYNAVEKRPEFPGGIQEFYNFVAQNYRAPETKDLKGKVFIQFVVEADGSITNIENIRDIGHGTGEEAVRVMQLSPSWIPGEQDGKPVRVLYSLPISIRGVE